MIPMKTMRMRITFRCLHRLEHSAESQLQYQRMRKLEKADSWFQKAAILDPDYGDTWAWWFKFLAQHGTDEKREEVVSKCVQN